MSTIQFLATYKFINSLGLLLDIVGIVLIWKYGLPVNDPGRMMWGLSADPREMSEREKYVRLGNIGLIFIIGGFILQIFSNFVN